MKILLIGHSIIDHFVESGKEIVKPGGIFYSVVGILSVKKESDNIFLLTGMNRNHFNLFEKTYSKINLGYVIDLDEMPEVFLKVYEDKEREEIYKNLSTSLSIEKIKNWSQFDGILINMITGFDITIEQLNIIRSNYNGIIYFDVHTLSRGVNENLKREFRPIPKINEWLINIDILQCNESELTTIFSDESEEVVAKKIIENGPNILIVTKGNKGAKIFFKEKDIIQSYYLPAEEVNVINKIGCGDIFGAVFFYVYLSTKDFYKSLKLAAKVASIFVSSNIIEKIDELKLNVGW